IVNNDSQISSTEHCILQKQSELYIIHLIPQAGGIDRKSASPAQPNFRAFFLRRGCFAAFPAIS
ncbi:hypothetical protein, partial [Enterocloster sp.]|uniref:hypothetical protein n=1 Tax=Enterocloster sp. TaxID=2719315 RepID=UPI002846C9B8